MVNEYEKAVKRRLIELDKPQKWLISEAKRETGLYLDSSYLSKILSGRKKAPRMRQAITRILELGGESTK